MSSKKNGESNATMSLCRTHASIAAFALLLLLSSEVCAQDEHGIDSLEIAISDSLAPIAIRDIASEVVDARIRLRVLRKHVTQGDELVSIRRDWAQMLSHIEELNTYTEATLDDRSDPDWMAELELRWKSARAELENVVDDLSGKAGVVSDGILELVTMRRRWDEALDAAQESQLSPVVVTNIDSLLLDIDGLIPQMDARLNSILELDVEISLVNLDISDAIERVSQRDAEALFEHLRQNIGPPIPGFVGDLYGNAPVSSGKFYAVPLWGMTVRYLDKYRERVVIHFVIFLVLVLLFVSLRRTSDTWSDGVATKDTDLRILERPFSAAALIALLAIVFVYQNPPIVLVSIATLVSTIPLVRLLTTTLPLVFHRLLYGIAAFMAIVTLTITATPFDMVYARIAILILNVSAVIFLARFIRRDDIAATLEESGISRVILTGIRLAIVFLIAAVVAESLGFARLSSHLTIGTDHSAYFVLLFHIGAQVLVILAVGILISPLGMKLRMVRNHARMLVRRTTKLMQLVMVLFAVDTVLAVFGVSAPLYSWIRSVLTDPFTIGAAQIAVGDILLFFLAVWASVLLARFIRFALQEDVLSRFKMKRGLPNAISGTVYYILVMIGFIVALQSTGMELDRFTLLTGALGVGLGFGLQDIVNNFVSGVILMYENPIQVGDLIGFDTETGVVKRIGIRSSVVQTFEGADINVPNSHLVSNRVTNWTMYDARRRISVDFGVEYGSDPNTIQDLIIRAAHEHPDVETRPEPVVLFTQMADSSLTFELRCWTRMGRDWLNIKSDLTARVYNILGEAGVKIPFPQRELHVRNLDE
jgi:potassium efflux system protein